MRKSHKQIKELIEARTHDYSDNQASEAVYRASLKALGVSRTEIELLVGRVQHSVQRRESYEDRRLEASARYVKDYCNASRGKDRERIVTAGLQLLNQSYVAD